MFMLSLSSMCTQQRTHLHFPSFVKRFDLAGDIVTVRKEQERDCGNLE